MAPSQGIHAGRAAMAALIQLRDEPASHHRSSNGLNSIRRHYAPRAFRRSGRGRNRRRRASKSHPYASLGRM